MLDLYLSNFFLLTAPDPTFLQLLLLLLLLWGTSQSKVALANARDLSGSRERMPKSTLSLPKCCCLFISKVTLIV